MAYQFGTTANEFLYALASDSSSNLIVGGATDGALCTDRRVKKSTSAGSAGAIGTCTETLCRRLKTGTTADYESSTCYSYNVWLAKFTKDGVEVWSKVFGTDGYDKVDTIFVDDDDNIFVGGSVSGDQIDGTVTGGVNQGTGGLIMREYYDDIWLRSTRLMSKVGLRSSAARVDYVSSIAVNSFGKLYFGGAASNFGTLNIGAQNVSDAGCKQWRPHYKSR